ncbi:hypothetical protein JCM1840_004780 [Sporobolomyces johnsonii]
MKEWRRSELNGQMPEEKDVVVFGSCPTPDLFTLPAPLTSPSSILTVHRSIVNTTLFHPTLPYLVTSGVKKVIICHSPSPSSSSTRLQSRSPSPSASHPPPPSWHFVPHPLTATYRHPPLFCPPDPGLETALRHGETGPKREHWLRREDTEVLKYFDGLVELEEEGLWAGGSEDEEDEEDEKDEEEQARWGIRGLRGGCWRRFID